MQAGRSCTQEQERRQAMACRHAELDALRAVWRPARASSACSTYIEAHLGERITLRRAGGRLARAEHGSLRSRRSATSTGLPPHRYRAATAHRSGPRSWSPTAGSAAGRDRLCAWLRRARLISPRRSASSWRHARRLSRRAIFAAWPRHSAADFRKIATESRQNSADGALSAASSSHSSCRIKSHAASLRGFDSITKIHVRELKRCHPKLLVHSTPSA